MKEKLEQLIEVYDTCDDENDWDRGIYGWT